MQSGGALCFPHLLAPRLQRPQGVGVGGWQEVWSRGYVCWDLALLGMGLQGEWVSGGQSCPIQLGGSAANSWGSTWPNLASRLSSQGCSWMPPLPMHPIRLNTPDSRVGGQHLQREGGLLGPLSWQSLNLAPVLSTGGGYTTLPRGTEPWTELPHPEPTPGPQLTAAHGSPEPAVPRPGCPT